MTRTRGAAVLLCALLTLTACGGSGEPAGNGGTGGGAARTFSVALTEPDHLTPGNTSSSYSITVLQALFDTLVVIDPSGTPQMRAAESVTSDDQKVWTIKIKAGQKFHNGELVTAQSFADAWNAAAYGPNAWTNNYYFANIEGYDKLNPEAPEGSDEAPKPETDKLSGLKVIDDSTLEVTLTAPFSQFPITLAYTGFAPMPKAAFTDPSAYDVKPIGNGPFMMDGDWKRNQLIKVKRFDGYAGPRPAKSAGVDFKIYASRETAYTDLRAGNVDLLQTIPPASAAEARTLLGERFVATPSGTMDYLGFPVFDKRFANPDLRKSFSMAIDRQAIVNAVFSGTFKPMSSLVAPLVPGYRENPCGEACAYDPVRAKELFTKAGGFSGTLNLYFSNADPSYEQWMTAVANQLKQNLGIADIKFRKIPAADYLSTLREHKQDGPYRNNWVMDYPSPQNYLESMWGEGNRMGWENQRFLDLIEQANAAPSMEASIPLYQKAEDLALAEMPMMPLWNWQDQAGHSDKITNVRLDAYSPNLDTITVK
ncbi:peptide/nickel transport system substrate-binding protein/oligopeptide transport system substrate-binding protein [Thermocatellispora tengchongensis]|uniref:Peptide/nickel transport system substrate-binding protein/oligopeptide transport system substrate-binding protein n=1 Tax=Thermocatellispora tengchongensis TaxID=1073253 RepID=A0A840P0F3_9ACTN|nr:ABC transporter substrate-binding protein [Thermocatellispora tengchongensis]MBB5131936.1 peptide/nickel transport system substrate-binding protein/oligopeptide transport system substrate-binding protein [Thermocatellispora tengchongensis]